MALGTELHGSWYRQEMKPGAAGGALGGPTAQEKRAKSDADWLRKQEHFYCGQGRFVGMCIAHNPVTPCHATAAASQYQC